MFAAPPTQVALNAAKILGASGGNTLRNSSDATTMPMQIDTIAHANTPSTRGPSAMMARTSQVTISRNSSAGSACAVMPAWVARIASLLFHKPLTAKSIAAR